MLKFITMAAEKTVSIGVHIWVPGKVGSPEGMAEVEDNAEYVSARARRLAQGPDNQILLIVGNFYHDTRDHFKLGPEWDGHLIQTEFGTPKPKGMNFRELRERILDFTPAEEYVFWGTELYFKGAQVQRPTWGCVKGAVDNLKLPNSKIDISSCWVNAFPGGVDPTESLVRAGVRSIRNHLNPGRLLRAISSK